MTKKMIKAYKVKLYPTKEQEEKIIKFCHASRFCYNWALATEMQNFKDGKPHISGYDLAKLLTQLKKEPEHQWLKEVSARALKVSVMDCGAAYKNFFNKQKTGKKFTDKAIQKAKRNNRSLTVYDMNGHPKFKVKGKAKMSCATHEGTTIIEHNRIRLEKLGWVKCSKNNIPKGSLYNPTIKFDGVSFWFIVSKEILIKNNDKPKTEPIGIDLGLKTLAVCSNGEILKKPNIKKLQKRLKRLQRRASRQYQPMIDYCKETKTKFNTLQKSKNLLKLEKEIKSIHIRINNILTTNIHEFTKNTIKLNPSAIVIEDLNVSGMKKNRHLSKAISEAKFYEIRRQFEYKCNWYDVGLIIADRFFPSSKMCSECGSIKKDLKLKDRVYRCDCGLVIDRDVNASYNLRNLAL